MSDGPSEITIYLQRLKDGDPNAEGPLAEAVYGRMLQLGRAAMVGGTFGVSLQPTALVNEVLLELIRLRSVDWQDRAHFFRTASRLLRRRLIDHIRSGEARKRPPNRMRQNLDEMLLPAEDRFEEILCVHEGLDQLAEFDAPLAELIEMVYFGGVTIAAAAEIRNVSEKTIDRQLELGRRWLAKTLGHERPSTSQPHAYTFDRR